MPKAVFFNVPGFGHIIPSLPLVKELAKRGHDISYFATTAYRQQIEASGARFNAYKTIQDDYFTSAGLSGSVPQKVAHALISTSEEILPELLELTRAEKPDYILFDGMCPWGYLIARILKLPAIASLSLAPLITPPLSALPQMLPYILPMIFRDFTQGLEANRRANVLAKQYGLPPFAPTGIMNNMGDLSLSYTSRFFQAYADTVPDNVCFVGWTPYEMPATKAFEAVPGKPLVYVSLGTLNNDDISLFKTIIEALKDEDCSVLIATGNRIVPEAFGTLPEHISVRAWVAQTEILKHAAVFISHSGLNSVHDSLYFGVPLLLVPQQAEQSLTAMRVAELGAGLLCKKKAISLEVIRSNTRRLLNEPQFKKAAQAIGETLREAGGAVRAADEIEVLLVKQAVH